MNKVKVLLTNQPRMLRESLRLLLERQTDIEVVGAEALEPLDILAAVEQTGAQVVVLTLPNPDRDPGLCSHLLNEFPDILVIAVGAEEPKAQIYRQIISKTTLDAPSERNLLEAIRSCHHDVGIAQPKIEKTIGRSEE